MTELWLRATGRARERAWQWHDLLVVWNPLFWGGYALHCLTAKEEKE